MDQKATQQRFTAALDALVAEVKRDRSILAAILCGSLSHDVVWEKSDIDLMFVTIDDKQIETSDVSIYADGVNVHAFLMSRTAFRQLVEGSTHNSFMHSLLAKGRLLYTHDETIATFCERLHDIGSRDTDLQLLRAATHALPPLYKAHKWFETRGDLDYTALWILYTATPLAQIEVLSRRLVVDREVIPQALTLNPALFARIYTELLNAPKTRESVKAALDAIDGYLTERARTLFAPVLEHLREVGEARSMHEIDDHFTRHMNISHITTACEYLADAGLIGRASSPVRLTKRSNIEVQQLAFYYLDPTP
jgi:hypothetical protein